MHKRPRTAISLKHCLDMEISVSYLLTSSKVQTQILTLLLVLTEVVTYQLAILLQIFKILICHGIANILKVPFPAVITLVSCLFSNAGVEGSSCSL